MNGSVERSGPAPGEAPVPDGRRRGRLCVIEHHLPLEAIHLTYPDTGAPASNERKEPDDERDLPPPPQRLPRGRTRHLLGHGEAPGEDAVSGLPALSLRHLAHLCDGIGVHAGANGDRPLAESGYRMDDAGRTLGLASRLAHDPDAHRLASVSVGLLERAYLGRGRFHRHLGPNGRWSNDAPTALVDGRVLHGLGLAAERAVWPEVRAQARRLFDDAVRVPVGADGLADAALGAVAVLHAEPTHAGARQLVGVAAALLPRDGDDAAWPWPEARLAPDSALLPEALLATSLLVADPGGCRAALRLLAWLLARQTRQTWFSFTPTGGRTVRDATPAFEQPPLGAWAMADACAAAYACTGEDLWARAVARAARWFTGDNDTGDVLFDAASGGAFDALTATGPRRDQGAEAALALVGTMARVRCVGRSRHVTRTPFARVPVPAR